MVSFFVSCIKKQRLLISFFLKMDKTSKKPIIENQPHYERVPNMVVIQNQ